MFLNALIPIGGLQTFTNSRIIFSVCYLAMFEVFNSLYVAYFCNYDPICKTLFIRFLNYMFCLFLGYNLFDNNLIIFEFSI